MRRYLFLGAFLILVSFFSISCMKAKLDWSSPEGVVNTFANAAKHGNYETLVKTTSGELRKELDALGNQDLEKRFKNMENAYFTFSKKVMDMEVDNYYTITAKITKENGNIEFLIFHVKLEEDKWLIFKIIGGKNE
ncbi:hypothetical protein KAU33_16915 [Candidatus Dependentiae bacterium]|nr:hypothetical protein [Candidatus Dependentiae bacterium]